MSLGWHNKHQPTKRLSFLFFKQISSDFWGREMIFDWVVGPGGNDLLPSSSLTNDGVSFVEPS